jgi:hypothetical protein
MVVETRRLTANWNDKEDEKEEEEEEEEEQLVCFLQQGGDCHNFMNQRIPNVK